MSAARRGASGPPRIVLLWGDDAGAIQDALRELRTEVLGDGAMAAFNHERFDAPYTASITPVLQACAQVPMLASRRLVELSAPEAFGKHVGGGDASAALDALVTYAASPSPSALLVITSTALRANARLVGAIGRSAHGEARRFELPDDGDAAAGVRALARARGIEVAPEAVERLVRAVGPARAELEAALERARAHAGSDRVGPENVDAVVVDTREANVFELTDAVGRGDHRRALELLARTFTGGEKDFGTGQRVFSLLLRQVRLVFAASVVRGDLASALGVPPFVARKLVDQARRTDPTRLRAAYKGLARIDAELKGGEPGSRLAYESPYLVLQRWILDVCDALPGTEPRV